MFKCPKCSNENIQKASIIYENGTNDIDISVSGGGFSAHGNIAVGGGSGNGKSQSKLAAKMAPPKEKSFLFILFLLFWPRFFLWVIFTAAQAKGGLTYQVIHWGFIALLIFIFIRIRKYNKEVFPKILEDYNDTYFCHRCGFIFQIQQQTQ